MNNRDYKISVPGEYYHIYNRGNAKQDIFLDDDDYTFFLLRLSQNLFPWRFPKMRIKQLPNSAFSLLSYCLMPNHFHFLIRQNTNVPTGALLLKICTSYSKYFNKKYKRVGHIFQDQFKQVAVDNNEYLLWLSAYIHQNPKAANLVDNSLNYPWSSYQGFLSDANDILDPEQTKLITGQFGSRGDYKQFVDNASLLIVEKKNMESILLD